MASRSGLAWYSCRSAMVRMRLQQFVHSLAGDGAGLHHFDVAAPLAGRQAVFGHLRHDAIGVGARQVASCSGPRRSARSAALAWLIASSVCGMMPSSAATTSTAMSVTLAPRARISVKASWPGVSTKAIVRPFFSIW